MPDGSRPCRELARGVGHRFPPVSPAPLQSVTSGKAGSVRIACGIGGFGTPIPKGCSSPVESRAQATPEGCADPSRVRRGIRRALLSLHLARPTECFCPDTRHRMRGMVFGTPAQDLRKEQRGPTCSAPRRILQHHPFRHSTKRRSWTGPPRNGRPATSSTRKPRICSIWLPVCLSFRHRCRARF
jgi:hypothetical protein